MPPGSGSFHLREVRKIAKHDDTRINDEITATRCRLIGVDGSQLGLFGIRDAQRVADEQGLDLVEIAPNADPPVCRVMDYGKYKYQQAMKAKAARKNQSRVEVKEMKFRPKIDVGRLRDQEGPRSALPEKGRSGEDHHHVPWPRDGTSGAGSDRARASRRRFEAVRHG